MPSGWAEAESLCSLRPPQCPPSPASYFSPPLSLCSLFCLWGISLGTAPSSPSPSSPALSPLSLEVPAPTPRLIGWPEQQTADFQQVPFSGLRYKFPQLERSRMNWGWCWLRMREPSSPQRSNVPLPSSPTILWETLVESLLCKEQRRSQGMQHKYKHMAWGMLGLDWGSPEEAPGPPFPSIPAAHTAPTPSHTHRLSRVSLEQKYRVFVLRASHHPAPRQSFAPSPSLLPGRTGK